MSTLRQVADRAGVSLATASRVATGSASVREETRRRVELAMRELLYVRQRRASTSGVLGLLVPELANPVFPALAQAMETRAAALGLAVIICNTEGSAAVEADYMHMLLERNVEGMIFVACEMANSEADHSHYTALIRKGARLVFVNCPSDSLPATSVGVDERASGYLATRHLLDLGHMRIGFVAGPGRYAATQEKQAGYGAALDAAGIEQRAIVHEQFGVEGGRLAARRLLEQPGPPTGLICSSDLMAIGVLLEARELGVRVPEELSVVGFDGVDAACWTQPALTTVEQPIAEIAATALDALQRLIENPEQPLPNFVFRPRLRLGASTAPPAKETR
jgi:DNA-binding LacI/PurR family transcriptional regulator